MKRNSELKTKWPWGEQWRWKERTEAIAEIVPPEASVLDIGGGWGYLHDLLPKNPYKAIDIEAWTDLTTVADLNKEYPDMGLFDVMVCQGIIEYVDDPKKFLESIHKYSRRAIMSYYNGDINVESRKNSMTFPEIENLLLESKWWIVSHRELSPNERIYYCNKIDL